MPMSIYIFIHAVLGLIGIGSGLVVTLRSPTCGRVNSLPVLVLLQHPWGSSLGLVLGLVAFCCPHRRSPISFDIGSDDSGILHIHSCRSLADNFCGWIVNPTLSQCFCPGLHSFLGVPVLHALARTQKGPPLLIAQHIVFSPFMMFNTLAAMKFHPEQTQAA
jgi:hypothetical protein